MTIIKRDGWLTSEEVLDYVTYVHERHWTRLYLYALQKKHGFNIQKIGHSNLYKQSDIDDYIGNLKRPSSIGVRLK